MRGILRQSDNANYCILVTSRSDQGDEMLEIELKDVVKHELEEKDEKEGESQVRLHIKTEAVVRKISNGKITDFAGSGQIREELIRKGPKAIRVRFNAQFYIKTVLEWMESAYERCETLRSFFNWTDEQFRDCVMAGYIRCGEPPRVDVDPESFLEDFRNFRKNIASL